MTKPLCFVLMPFGKKQNAAGIVVDFDSIYRDMIAPAISDAGLEPLRADAEKAGGIIHGPMYERLMLCKYAVADLSTGNPNVYYELGVRHAVRPWSTVMLYSNDGTPQMPFDVRPLRTIFYEVTNAGLPADAPAVRASLTKALRDAREAEGATPLDDSPIFQLVKIKDYAPPTTQTIETQLFEDHERALGQKEQVAAARRQGAAALRALEDQLGELKDLDAGVVIDLLLAYRGVEEWGEMLRLIGRMPQYLAETTEVQQQRGLALNRSERGDEAEGVLNALIARRGASSETCGILGRVYKDRWERALGRGNTLLAGGLLEKAIATYARGFEADWRDPYPGINAATLMEVKEPPDPQREKLLPLVVYAAGRRVASGTPTYWDYATLLEAHVLEEDEPAARQAAMQTLAHVYDKFGPGTTARNLRLIREARERRGRQVAWAKEIEEALLAAAAD